MFSIEQNPGRTAIVNGKEYLFFSGYSYLGMSHVPEFAALVKQGMDKYGWLFPSSRISNTQLDLFSAFETRLSAIAGMEETVCFSSGFVAGRAVVEMLQSTHQRMVCAPNTHPAICISTNKHQSFTQWAQQVVNEAEDNTIILFDSVNPLTAEVNDLSFLTNISKKITCVIDDSHAAGLLPDVKSRLPHHANIEYIIVYSLSKAYNLMGGAVSCSQLTAQKLRASTFYTASTSISPAFAYAFLHGGEWYHVQREKLQQNMLLFQTQTNNRFRSHPGLPVFVLPDAIDETALQQAGIIISSFAYPNPGGKKISRMVINALHTEDDLQQAANIIGKQLHHL